MNRTRKLHQDFSLSKLTPVFQSILVPDISIKTIMDRFTKKSIMDLAGNEKKHYFENSHVFLLAGHGEDLGTGERYELKQNEFYASATQCGRISGSIIQDKFKFITHNPTIKIPDESVPSSLYPLNYPNFPLKKYMSSEYTPNSYKFNTQIDAMKIYFPQSQFSHTKTIPLTNFHPVSFWKDEKSINYQGNPIPFEYNGKTDNINPAEYNIYILTISGVQRPNINIEEYNRKFNELKLKSDYLRENLFPNHVFKLNFDFKYFLSIILPKNVGVYFNSNMSYYMYAKDVIETVFSLSFIRLDEFINILNPILTFHNIFYFKIRIDNLINKIRTKLGDDKPILIINNLCRPVPEELRHKIPELRYNSNTEINVRTIKSKKRLNYSIFNIMAETSDKTKVLEKYIRNGGDPNVINSEGTPLLHMFIGNISIVNLLLNSGADPNITDINRQTPLHSLINRLPKYFNQITNSEEKSSKNNYIISIIEKLLRFGTNINAKETNNKTPLHLLINKILYNELQFENVILILNYLINNGANININILDDVVSNNLNISLLDFLISNGAIIHSRKITDFLEKILNNLKYEKQIKTLDIDKINKYKIVIQKLISMVANPRITKKYALELKNISEDIFNTPKRTYESANGEAWGGSLHRRSRKLRRRRR